MSLPLSFVNACLHLPFILFFNGQSSLPMYSSVRLRVRLRKTGLRLRLGHSSQFMKVWTTGSASFHSECHTHTSHLAGSRRQ